jgi:hypothetical protein
VKYRDTVEAIVGAMTVSLEHPEVLVVGSYRGKELEVVGRPLELKPDQSAAIAPLLKPGWCPVFMPDEISTRFGSCDTAPTSQRLTWKPRPPTESATWVRRRCRCRLQLLFGFDAALPQVPEGVPTGSGTSRRLNRTDVGAVLLAPRGLIR